MPAERSGAEEGLRAGCGERLVLVGLVLLGSALRFWRFDELPGGLLYDEAYNGLDVRAVLEGARPLFFSANYGREPLFIYLQAAAVWALGPTSFALRVVALAFGVLAIPTTYVAVRRLAGGNAGVLAAAWVATAPWPLIFSRIGLRPIAAPVFLALGFYAVARALDERSERRGLLLGGVAGACMAAAVTTYSSARIAPAVPLLWLAIVGIGSPALRRQAAAVGLAMLLTCFLGIVPLAAHFQRHPEDFTTRLNEVSVFSRSADSVETLRALGRSTLETAAAFHVRGDELWDRNVGGRPVFDPVTGALSLVGLAGAVLGRRHRGRTLLMLWLAVLAVPHAITSVAIPNFPRLIGSMPAAAGLMGLGASMLLDQTTPRVRPILTAGLIGWCGVVGATTVFGTWASEPQRYYLYHSDRVGALRAAIWESATAPRVYLAAPDEIEPIAGFLAGPAERRPFARFDPTTALPAPAGGAAAAYVFTSALAPSERERWVGRWETRGIGPDGAATVEVFRGAAPKAPAPDRPLGLRVGDVALVHGYTLPRRVRPGERLAVRLDVETVRRDGRDLVWFAHLVDRGERAWAGRDLRGFPAAGWVAGETVRLAVELAVPPAAEAGAYRVAVGLYDRASLGRLPVEAGGDRIMLGPVWVGADGAPGPAPERAASAPFSDGIRLEGYAVGDAGAAGSLRLHWRATGRPRRDYTVFVHVLDHAGRLLAQADGQPARPTSTWEEGDAVVDERRIELPPATAALAVGLYELETGRRVPLAGGGDHVFLPVDGRVP